MDIHKPIDNNPSFMREAFSERGVASSKRLLGALCLLVCLGVISYLAFTEGGTDTVENLLQTVLIVAATLLGLGSITRTASDIFTAKGEMKDSTKEIKEDAAE